VKTIREKLDVLVAQGKINEVRLFAIEQAKSVAPPTDLLGVTEPFFICRVTRKLLNVACANSSNVALAADEALDADVGAIVAAYADDADDPAAYAAAYVEASAVEQAKQHEALDKLLGQHK